MHPEKLHELFRNKIEYLKNHNIFRLDMKQMTPLVTSSVATFILTASLDNMAVENLYKKAAAISPELEKYLDRCRDGSRWLEFPCDVKLTCELAVSDPYDTKSSGLVTFFLDLRKSGYADYDGFSLGRFQIPANADIYDADNILKSCVLSKFASHHSAREENEIKSGICDEKMYLFLEIRDVNASLGENIMNDIRRVADFYKDGVKLPKCLAGLMDNEISSGLLERVADMRLVSSPSPANVDGRVRFAFEASHERGKESEMPGKKEFFATGITVFAGIISDILKAYNSSGIVTGMAVCCGDQQRALSFAADRHGFNTDTMTIDSNIATLYEQDAAREANGMRM